MAANNSFFDWAASLTRFVKRDTARAEEINDALDSISNGFTATEALTNAAIKLPAGETSAALGNAAARKGKVLTFNAITGAAETIIATADVATVAVNAAKAEVAATAAEEDASEAGASAQLAADWASKPTGTVDGTNKSSKLYAMDAAQSAIAAAASTGLPLISGVLDAGKGIVVSASGAGYELGSATDLADTLFANQF